MTRQGGKRKTEKQGPGQIRAAENNSATLSFYRLHHAQQEEGGRAGDGQQTMKTSQASRRRKVKNGVYPQADGVFIYLA